MIFVASAVFCQEIGIKAPGSTGFSPFKPAGRPGKITFSYFHKEKSGQAIQLGSGKPNINLSTSSCLAIGADFYTRNFGFFCKRELQFEKVTKIPVRFRLGSLQYNDYLEQKPNSINPF